MADYANIQGPSVPNNVLNAPGGIINALFTPPILWFMVAAVFIVIVYYVFARLSIGPRPD